MTEREGESGARRRRIDSVIPDILKRAVQHGVERASEGQDNLKTFVHEMKLPKELAAALLQQVDETKAGLFRVVAKEMRDFLDQAKLAEEIQKLLASVELEVKATVAFKPRGTAAAPSVSVGRRTSSPPPSSSHESTDDDAHS
jgi:hypothetical protein